MDSAQKQLTYDERKLLQFDGRARMRRLSKEFGHLAGNSIILLSAAGDYIGMFESPSHAEIYCAAKGVELAPGIEEITWNSLETTCEITLPFILQAAP